MLTVRRLHLQRHRVVRWLATSFSMRGNELHKYRVPYGVPDLMLGLRSSFLSNTSFQFFWLTLGDDIVVCVQPTQAIQHRASIRKPSACESDKSL